MNRKVSALETTINGQEISHKDINTEIEEIANMNSKLVEVAIKQDNVLEQTKKEVKKLVKTVHKGEFLITGIERRKDRTHKQQVEHFIAKALEISTDVNVVSAHPVGKRVSAPMWFRLEDPDDIALIFTHVSNLKEKVNKFGNPYRLREFRQEEDQERETRFQDLIQDNRRLPMSHQMETKRSKGELTINGEMYTKKVCPPTMKEVLLSTESKSLREMKIHVGEMKVVNGSAFYGYAKEVSSFDQIKEAYRALRDVHITASSIMCGYRIFGTKHYELQDYSDDSEHGGGRRVLEALRSAGVWNMAVFVVRYHDGPNLGNLRFETILNIANDTIASFPKALNYGRNLPDQALFQILTNLEKDKKTAIQIREQKAAKINRAKATRRRRSSRAESA